MQLEIRNLGLEGIATAVDWARLEGWNPGLRDAGVFAAATAPGDFIGLYANDILAATISLVSYGPDFGFLGFYICKPEMRGKGLGMRLWNEALSRSSARCIGLDGVKAQQANYARSGFVYAHGNLRYGGPKPTVDSVPAGVLEHLGPQHTDEIAAFEADRRLFPAPRPAFLAAWLSHEALALRENGRLQGYGIIRRCHDGHKIGPLFAETAEQAGVLLRGLLAGVSGGNIFFDVPATNPAAVAMARSLGLSPMFETARMYRGPAPDLDTSQIFGITTFELG